jgi:DNA-binding HxlR family transcriptional regulator
MKKYVRKIDLKIDCPFELFLHVTNGKWKPAILSGLMKSPQRPKDILQALPECSKRVLFQQLNELEQDGIITKNVYPGVPLRVEYVFTDLGLALIPVIHSINEWGCTYHQTAATFSSAKQKSATRIPSQTNYYQHGQAEETK